MSRKRRFETDPQVFHPSRKTLVIFVNIFQAREPDETEGVERGMPDKAISLYGV